MVDIEYQPIKKIIVHEIIKYSLNEFINLKGRVLPGQAQPLPVRWAEGIVFSNASYAGTSPEMLTQQLEGITHWAAVEFAELDDYRQILNHPTTGTAIQLVDNSNNKAVSYFILWLKKRPEWSTSTRN